VASVEVPPFMAIHFINAYEEKGEDGQAAAVIVDCCEHYGDPAIIETLVLHRLRSLREKDVLPDARYNIGTSTGIEFHYSIHPVRVLLIWCICRRVGRFKIPLDGSSFGELTTAMDPEEHGRGMDMCSINQPTSASTGTLTPAEHAGRATSLT
jgi:carlactone synthase / all-trans-10'-apo-beta-carotenal 13,14-cleaving dioxygenase